MKIALIGAELEENLGLRYMASVLEAGGHEASIIPFNAEQEIPEVAKEVDRLSPEIVGLSIVFTNRAGEFCILAETIREKGYTGHIIAGGPFAAFNFKRLLGDYPALDSVGIGEGEEIILALANALADPVKVPGLCYRDKTGRIVSNKRITLTENLDTLPFPKRTTFHEYFGKPIGSILSSRGCWRSCAFCSINAWYKQMKGKKFRVRSVSNLVEEMRQLYSGHGVRIFNFQDDNFFLPDKQQALERFHTLRSRLTELGMTDIAIAVKARPDSITHEAVTELDQLGLFRVFLGVENASQRGLDNLNRKCTTEQVLQALEILNRFDVHIAYNLLLFEPGTTMDDIRLNLDFMEKHVENPFNFCRAEVHACTGLEEKLQKEGKLLGNYFSLDYRLNNPLPELFHRVANYIFFERNFSNFGLHYFNMQVDFYYQLLRRFYPQLLSRFLRGAVRSFIKKTNIDTYKKLCLIYDFILRSDPGDEEAIRSFMKTMRYLVSDMDHCLHKEGELLLEWITGIYTNQTGGDVINPVSVYLNRNPETRNNVPSGNFFPAAQPDSSRRNLLNFVDEPVPYKIFKESLVNNHP